MSPPPWGGAPGSVFGAFPGPLSVSTGVFGQPLRGLGSPLGTDFSRDRLQGSCRQGQAWAARGPVKGTWARCFEETLAFLPVHMYPCTHALSLMLAHMHNHTNMHTLMHMHTFFHTHVHTYSPTCVHTPILPNIPVLATETLLATGSAPADWRGQRGQNWPGSLRPAPKPEPGHQPSVRPAPPCRSGSPCPPPPLPFSLIFGGFVFSSLPAFLLFTSSLYLWGLGWRDWNGGGLSSVGRHPGHWVLRTLHKEEALWVGLLWACGPQRRCWATAQP